MKIQKIALLFILLFWTSTAIAEINPPKGPYDARVRIVTYNPLDVVRLSTFYGVSTHVHFDESETIKDVAVGDDQAWKIVTRGNNMFIKPLTEKADTNITVITTRRMYQFCMVVNPRSIKDEKAWADPELIYSISFYYKDDEEALIEKKAKEDKQKIVHEDVNKKLNEAKGESRKGDNYDYWVAGSEEISPTAARDDSRFIYLTFSYNRDMPAIYEVDKAGKESLINTNVINGNTIVIQRMVRQLMLRKGDLVASVLNKSFDPDGGKDNKTGTVAPDVQRVIRGGDQP